jgi:diguanylate cyclase (GGDEF)-like protein
MIAGATHRPEPLALPQAALDMSMPLHLRLGPDGRILHTGPTLRRVVDDPLMGDAVTRHFDFLRPAGLDAAAAPAAHPGTRVKLRLRRTPDISLRGVALPLGAGQGTLLNLSFGISVVEAVRRFGLTNEDFAVTDLAIELLYLIEAKSAVMAELGRLNDRLRHARAAAEEQAFTDALTGLANRRALEGVFDEAAASGRPFALMRIDLDFFKEVNDRFGHAAGDRVLAETARRLRDGLRDGDMVARVGGDEFVLLLAGEASPDALEALTARLIARLSDPVPHEGAACRVSASIGVTTSALYDGPVLDTLLRDADAALYISKRDGRSRATLVTPDLLAAGRLDQVLGAESR